MSRKPFPIISLVFETTINEWGSTDFENLLRAIACGLLTAVRITSRFSPVNAPEAGQVVAPLCRFLFMYAAISSFCDVTIIKYFERFMFSITASTISAFESRPSIEKRPVSMPKAKNEPRVIRISVQKSAFPISREVYFL